MNNPDAATTAGHVCRCDYCGDKLSFVSVGELCEAAADKARASERQRIRQLAVSRGIVNGVNVARVVADLLDGDGDEG